MTFCPQTAKVAANCIRSLLVQANPTLADQSIARALLPRMIAFMTNTQPEDPESARALVAQTLVQYVATLSQDNTPVAMALVVPTLLARAAGEGEGEGYREVYRATSARLLELASVDQAAFRSVVGAMSEGQKAFMEEVIKAGRPADHDRKRIDDGNGQPAIALKMEFGS